MLIRSPSKVSAVDFVSVRLDRSHDRMKLARLRELSLLLLSHLYDTVGRL